MRSVLFVLLLVPVALLAQTAHSDPADPAAMFQLGSRYFNGQNVAKDYQQARKWYEAAAASGV
jgi:TPR repeat protein